ncbi:MAG TPA: hypothetical protein VFY69_02910 [Solirubrobacterales bacterium]|nr:hypothetical protein [Solirubrobacterales bacterium]
MSKGEASAPSAAEKAEAVRVQRLREDAKRPISVNLEETIALSHKLMRFAGSARAGRSRGISRLEEMFADAT